MFQRPASLSPRRGAKVRDARAHGPRRAALSLFLAELLAVAACFSSTTTTLLASQSHAAHFLCRVYRRLRRRRRRSSQGRAPLARRLCAAPLARARRRQPRLAEDVPYIQVRLPHPLRLLACIFSCASCEAASKLGRAGGRTLNMVRLVRWLCWTSAPRAARCRGSLCYVLLCVWAACLTGQHLPHDAVPCPLVMPHLRPRSPLPHSCLSPLPSSLTCALSLSHQLRLLP